MAPLNWSRLDERGGIAGEPASIISLQAANLEPRPGDSEKVNKQLKSLQKRGMYSDIRELNVNPSLEDTKANEVNLDILFTFLRPFSY